MKEIEIYEEIQGELLILRLKGRLDALTSEHALEKIQASIDRLSGSVLLDFTNIDYLSSSGMRVLLSVYKNLKEKKRKLGVCSVADGVSDVLRMSGFMEVIPIFSTEAKAREALTPKETAKQT